MNDLFNPFSTDIHRTERTLNQKLVEWINEIIKQENLPFGFCEQETSGIDRKQPDIILYKSSGSKEIALVLELKPPFFNPLDYEQVKKPAWEKANVRKAPFFATSNFKSLILFNTQKANEQLPELQQIVNKYILSTLSEPDQIEEPIYKNQIIKVLTIFLTDLSSFVFEGKETEKLAIDEWLILILQEHVSVLASYYQGIIKEQCFNDLNFRRKVQRWFNLQGWNFVLTDEITFNKVARQTAYWLANKILFYDVFRSTDPQHFSRLEITDDCQNADILSGILQVYFKQILKIDYKYIFTTDFIDEIAFPQNKNVVLEIRKLITDLDRFNFAEIEYEILGRIFEGLIPAEERHSLGQYFTNPDIVDLILAFCLRSEKDIIFDPGCGAGTFLRRAYHWKKLQNAYLTHEEILPTLWGNDIDKFAAGLSIINLAIVDLRSSDRYPRITQKDFFAWLPQDIETEQKRKVLLNGGGEEDKETYIPKYFDAIIGNPPYTRQEEMNDKESQIDNAVLDSAGNQYANISRRAGIYAYFFVHGAKFLKQGGRFGFIVSNSWLDVDYGKGLQEHFLKHYKISAIVESKVERWFAEADINTCLVLLEKCEGEGNGQKKEREENSVRFVTLKKPLSEFIPKASRIFEETVERKEAAEKFWQNIFSKTSFFENDDLRVFIKPQKELQEEGWDEGKQEFIGSKWGRFLRAPEIYFQILEKAKDKLIPLKEVADVRFGIKTGANEFFYLTEDDIKRRKIEDEFWKHQDDKGEWIPNCVIKSPKECRTIVVDPKDLKFRVLLIHKNREQLRGTRMLDYIREGEGQGFSKHPTCTNRKNWWDLDEIKGDIFCMMSVNDRYAFWKNNDSFIDARLYEIAPKDKRYTLFLTNILNSTFSFLFLELLGRTNLGEGVLDIKVYEYQQLLTIKTEFSEERLNNNIVLDGKVGSIFEELGVEDEKDVALDKVKPDRRELDKIVMGEILGLTDEEQLAVYRAVIDLVQSRLSKAQSVERRSKSKEGVDLKLLAKTVIEKIGAGKLAKFYKKEILSSQDLIKIVLPDFSEKPKVNRILIGFRLEAGKDYLDFETEEEARYCQAFWKAGWREVEIPRGKMELKKVLPKLLEIIADVEETISLYIEGVIDQKIIAPVEQLIWHAVSKIN